MVRKLQDCLRVGLIRCLGAALALTLVSVRTTTQLAASVSIENILISNSDCYFDVYLMKASTDDENIYLAGSDFIIQFDLSNFEHPSISKVEGYCMFIPSLSTAANIEATRLIYHQNTMATIIDDMIVINLNGSSPNASTIETQIAVINDEVQKHRLGRFRISGMIAPAQGVGLQWKLGDVGLNTMLYSFENTSQFMAAPVQIAQGEIQPCLMNRSIEYSPLQDGVYRASQSLSGSGMVLTGSSVVFSAGDTVVLIPEFEVQPGGVFTIVQDGCDP